MFQSESEGWKDQCSSSRNQAGGVPSYSWGDQPFCSAQAFSGLDEAPPCESEQSSVYRFKCSSHPKTLSQHTQTRFDPISEPFMAQSSWHIKVAIAISESRAKQCYNMNDSVATSLLLAMPHSFPWVFSHTKANKSPAPSPFLREEGRDLTNMNPSPANTSKSSHSPDET